jgi:hypothetical protein
MSGNTLARACFPFFFSDADAPLLQRQLASISREQAPASGQGITEKSYISLSNNRHFGALAFVKPRISNWLYHPQNHAKSSASGYALILYCSSGSRESPDAGLGYHMPIERNTC